MRIVFMGTPDFAVASLKALLNAGEQVVAVVTQPDKPKGRGKQVQPPPVKTLALEQNLSVLQPSNIRTEEFIKTLQDLQPDCIVVVAYGKILPIEVLDLPAKGCINVHASLLPSYRGSAPIHWALINGETETGVTTMFMNEGMDTGDMIIKKHLSISPLDNVGILHDKLAEQGAKLLVETIKLLKADQAPRVSQDHTLATYAPMLRKEHELIHWDRSAQSIYNHVRGMNPWPGTYTTWEDKILKIWNTKLPEKKTMQADPGMVLDVNPSGILVQTGLGQIIITELQLQGGKRMDVAQFIRGKNMNPGTLFGNRGVVEK